MNAIQVIAIITGLFLDSGIVMIQKGSSIKTLQRKKTLGYSLVIALISVVAVLLGYGISFLFKDMLSTKMEFALSALIIFGVGFFFLVNSFRNINYVEKLDKDFSLKKLAILTCAQSIDLLIVGVGLSLLDVSLSLVLISVIIASILTAIIGLSIGYCYGIKYQRVLSMVGGALLVVLSLYLVFTVVAVA